jgi:hypothetical protein
VLRVIRQCERNRDNGTLLVGDLQDRDELVHRPVKQASACPRRSHKWNHAIAASSLPVTLAINHMLSTQTLFLLTDGLPCQKYLVHPACMSGLSLKHFIGQPLINSRMSIAVRTKFLSTQNSLQRIASQCSHAWTKSLSSVIVQPTQIYVHSCTQLFKPLHARPPYNTKWRGYIVHRICYNLRFIKVWYAHHFLMLRSFNT